MSVASATSGGSATARAAVAYAARSITVPNGIATTESGTPHIATRLKCQAPTADVASQTATLVAMSERVPNSSAAEMVAGASAGSPYQR